jgi:MFS transporter
MQAGSHDDFGAVSSNGLVLESLVSTRSRRDRHDGDLLAAICVDAVHRTVEPETRYDARGIAVDILAAHHSANLVLAAPGLSRRQVRPAAFDLGRRADGRRRLGSLGLCRQHLGAVFHLRRDLRIWHRHYLCGHHRVDGALVSGSAWSCNRACRRGLWVWRYLHQLSDRQHDQSAGYARTLVVWGIIQGVIGIIAAQGLRVPPEGWQPAGYAPAAAMQSRKSYTPAETLQSPIFWLLFLMMSMMSTSGLMVVSNVGPFAKEYSVADAPVLGMAALPLSLTLSRFTNGLTRPFFGWVSDHIGREMTMALAFSLECAAILVLFAFIDRPALFVVLTGLVFFGWGEIFSLFPSTLTDTFGPKYAATNYGFLYIAQGVGSILGGPAAALVKQTTGSWTAVFVIVAVLDALTALLAITLLRQMRRAHLQASRP